MEKLLREFKQWILWIMSLRIIIDYIEIVIHGVIRGGVIILIFGDDIIVILHQMVIDSDHVHHDIMCLLLQSEIHYHIC